MEIRFVRTQGQRDRVYVRRANGTETSWAFPTYGDMVPHDLVHLVVEAAFGLATGFWGRVDAGVDVARINAEANRRGGADKYQGFGEDLRGLLTAEALAGVAWSDPNFTASELLETMTRQCQQAGLTPPSSLTLERVLRVRAVLERLRPRWKSLVPKGTLLLHFEPRELEGSLRALEAPAATGRAET